MPHQTEAACLLQTGALYTRRIGLKPAEGDVVFAGFKPGAFSLYYGDEPIYHFDLEGRWQRAYVAGIHYLKGLDGSVVSVDRVREGANMVLSRRALAYAEASDLDATIRTAALELLDGLAAGRLERTDPPAATKPLADDELRSFLEQITRWDASAWFAHREKYAATYGPLGFLPPEAQQAVILQATLGHADGITFGLAPPHEHYVRTLDEFTEHAREVAGLLGRRALQCRNVYVAGGDFLRRDVEDAACMLEAAARVFPIDVSSGPKRATERSEHAAVYDGFCTFVDRLEPPLIEGKQLATLSALGLKRATIGLESGNRDVRRIYQKEWYDNHLRLWISDLKRAQIAVSLVLLVGAGGRALAPQHVEITPLVLNGLPLGPADIVYLLDASEVGGEHARAELTSRGLTPLSAQEAQEQQAQLRKLLDPLRKQCKAKVVPYTLEKLWT